MNLLRIETAKLCGDRVTRGGDLRGGKCAPGDLQRARSIDRE